MAHSWYHRRSTRYLTFAALGCILYVYGRTSVQAAKYNARQHREADGGQISWQKENLRRHGVLERPGQSNSVSELAEELRHEFTGSRSKQAEAKEEPPKEQP